MSKGTNAALLAGSYFSLALDFAGWAILLGGVSGMQRSCGSSDANFLLSGGAAGYNGAVPCDVFFGYVWWITFFNLFVCILAAITLANRLIYFRPGIIALLAIVTMQSMETANTYLYYDAVPTTSGTFVARAKTAAAGAIIKSVASLLLILLIGVRNEASTVYEKPRRGTGKTAAAAAAGAPPAGPYGPPPSQNVLEPRDIDVRPGRIPPPAPMASSYTGGGPAVGVVSVSPV